jgi:hypothetical protein
VRLFKWDLDFGVFFSTQGISNIGDAACNTGVAGVAGQVTGGLSMVWLGLILRFAPGRAAFIVLAAAAAALAAAVALAPKPPLPRPAPRQDQDQHPDIERTLVPPTPPPSP